MGLLGRNLLCSGAIILMILPSHSGRAQLGFGQVWEKYSGNPLFSAIGTPGSWNGGAPLSPLLFGHMIKDSNDQTYKIWIAGTPNGTNYSIGLWTSADGLAWMPHSGNPIMNGTSGMWDAAAVGNAMVIYDEGMYKMWYAGHDGTGVLRIGYATSPDGITWTKYAGNPVLEIGSQGMWDEAGVYGPYVVKVGSEYKMWYTGTRSDNVFQIGYASSPDGITWTRYSSNPVLSVGISGSWDQKVVALPCVLVEDGGFMLWFEGSRDPSVLVSQPQTGYARSSDGVNWTKDSNNPVLPVGGSTAWDRNVAIVTQVLNEGGVYKMWYGGSNLLTVFGAGLATLTAVSIDDHSGSIPMAFRLEQNFPNPFNPITTILYEIPTRGFVTLVIYDLLGRQMVRLLDGHQDTGLHAIEWDGKDVHGRLVSSGVYYYQVSYEPNFSAYRQMKLTRTMLLLR